MPGIPNIINTTILCDKEPSENVNVGTCDWQLDSLF